MTAYTDRFWAYVGKLALLVSTILGVFELITHFATPDITAFYERRRFETIHPELLASLERATDRQQLINTIRQLTKDGASIEEALQQVASQTDMFPVWERARFVLREVVEIEVRNDSNILASNARLLLPGSGFAMTRDGYTFDAEAKPFTWKEVVKLGDLRPGSATTVRVWPDQSTVLSTWKFALVYGHDRLGSVEEVQKFYGWDAELVSWFLQQPQWFRYGSALGSVSAIFALLLVAHRLGYVQVRGRVRLNRVVPSEPAGRERESLSDTGQQPPT